MNLLLRNVVLRIANNMKIILCKKLMNHDFGFKLVEEVMGEYLSFSDVWENMELVWGTWGNCSISF